MIITKTVILIVFPLVVDLDLLIWTRARMVRGRYLLLVRIHVVITDMACRSRSHDSWVLPSSEIMSFQVHQTDKHLHFCKCAPKCFQNLPVICEAEGMTSFVNGRHSTTDCSLQLVSGLHHLQTRRLHLNLRSPAPPVRCTD